MPATKNGNRWMIVLLVGIAVPVLGAGFAWINGRHETDMAHLLDHRAEDTSAVRAVSDRTIKLGEARDEIALEVAVSRLLQLSPRTPARA